MKFLQLIIKIYDLKLKAGCIHYFSDLHNWIDNLALISYILFAKGQLEAVNDDKDNMNIINIFHLMAILFGIFKGIS